ncbi:hypothetical protein FQN54_000050 [Arachnomyces sp. PD_36]|nr:hypothetical protein FQN54_000050 [Arachnomyces sp. PD_36]
MAIELLVSSSALPVRAKPENPPDCINRSIPIPRSLRDHVHSQHRQHRGTYTETSLLCCFLSWDAAAISYYLDSLLTRLLRNPHIILIDWYDFGVDYNLCLRVDMARSGQWTPI